MCKPRQIVFLLLCFFCLNFANANGDHDHMHGNMGDMTTEEPHHNMNNDMTTEEAHNHMDGMTTEESHNHMHDMTTEEAHNHIHGDMTTEEVHDHMHGDMTTEVAHNHMHDDMTTEEPHDHTNHDNVDCSTGNGDAMTCLHLGCCEWNPMMSMCHDVTIPDSNTNVLNRCSEATDADNCAHFGHAHECQGVTYTCVWDADSETCDRANECGSQSQMHCAMYESDDYECHWMNGACVVSQWISSTITTDAPDNSNAATCAALSQSMCAHYHHMNSVDFECVWNTHSGTCGLVGVTDEPGTTDERTTEQPDTNEATCAALSESMCGHYHHMNSVDFECVWNTHSGTCRLAGATNEPEGTDDESTEVPDSNEATCAALSESMCGHYHHMNTVDFECSWNTSTNTCEVQSDGAALSAEDAVCATQNNDQAGCEHYHHTNVVAFACVYNSETGVCSSTSLGNGATMDHSMMMYFHTGIGDILWFEDFKTDTDFKYGGACAAILAFAIVREVAVLYRRKIKKILHGTRRGNSVIGPDFNGEVKKHGPSDITYYSTLDTILVGISMFASYMLMLAFMTYNMGFCVVTIGSFMITNFFMNWYEVDQEISEDCCGADVEDQYPKKVYDVESQPSELSPGESSINKADKDMTTRTIQE